MRGAVVVGVAALGVFAVLKLRTFGAWTLPPAGEPYRALFEDATRRFNLPAGLLSRVAWQESRFRPEVIDGTMPGPVGEIGMMQLNGRFHPEQFLLDAIGVAGHEFDPRRPDHAIPYAAAYLAHLYRRFGAWDHVIGAYNWGQGNVNRALSEGRPLWSWPATTQTYVRGVLWDVGFFQAVFT